MRGCQVFKKIINTNSTTKSGKWKKSTLAIGTLTALYHLFMFTELSLLTATSWKQKNVHPLINKFSCTINKMGRVFCRPKRCVLSTSSSFSIPLRYLSEHPLTFTKQSVSAPWTCTTNNNEENPKCQLLQVFTATLSWLMRVMLMMRRRGGGGLWWCGK